MQWYVGMDRGKRQHQICLLNDEEEYYAEYSIPHSGQRFVDLTTWLSEQADAAAPETIGVVLESSSGPVVECCQVSGYTV